MFDKKLPLGTVAFAFFCYVLSTTKLDPALLLKNPLILLWNFIIVTILYGAFVAVVSKLDKSSKIVTTILSLAIALVFYFTFHLSMLQASLIFSGALLGGYKDFHRLLPALATLLYFILLYKSFPNLSHYVQASVVSDVLNYSKPILHQYLEMNYQSVANQQKEAILQGYDIATNIVIAYSSNISDENVAALSSILLQARKDVEQKIDAEIKRNKEEVIKNMENAVYSNICKLSSQHWKLILLLYLAIIYSIFSLFSSIAHLFYTLFDKIIEKNNIT